ncbi:MAG: hypothetical protein Q7S97_04240 [Polaromonas sp.]|nr:hypothetical protein [Polaromonas sp.]
MTRSAESASRLTRAFGLGNDDRTVPEAAGKFARTNAGYPRHPLSVDLLLAHPALIPVGPNRFSPPHDA